MNENTKKILADLKAAGIDTSSIERQISVDRLADRQFDNIVGNGILRQQDYSRYMNDLRTQEQNLQQQVQQLATLHDAQNNGVDLPQQTLDHIKALEEALIATGEFEENSVRNLSYQARVPLEKTIKDKHSAAINDNRNNNQNLNPTNFQLQQPNNVDLSNYVDAQTFRQALGNLAYGDIATNMEISARLEEVKQLGIPVTRKEIAKLQENLRKNFEGNGSLDNAFEETFEVSKAMQARQEADIEKRIKDETDRRVAEELKSAGIPPTKKFDFGRRHVIFDKNKTPESNQQPPKEGDPPVNKELPKNKFGDTEVFRGRRGRDERLQSSIATHNEVMEHLVNDPTYVPY